MLEAVERENETLDNPGFCLACGADAEGVEPDARRYPCESCGEPQVHGAQELLLHIPMTGPRTLADVDIA